MDFRVHDWIENKAYGNGQIIGDGETFWLIRFINHGEKKMLKGFIEHEGQPPYPSFAFPKAVTSKLATASQKKARSANPDFDLLFKKFLTKYPGGLSSPSFHEQEQEFKEKAVKKFADLLSRNKLSVLLEEGDYQEVAKRSGQVMSATNLVFHVQSMKFSDALKTTKNQRIFSEALYDILYGEDSEDARFEAYVKELGRIGVGNWPVATYFQFLKTKGKSMFMKPTVAKRMADSVEVALNYKPEPNWLTYSKLQETAATIKDRLLAAGQTLHSDIDIQSFMWCAYGIANE